VRDKEDSSLYLATLEWNINQSRKIHSRKRKTGNSTDWYCGELKMSVIVHLLPILQTFHCRVGHGKVLWTKHAAKVQ
jgi:hypothetical protein